MDASRPDLPSGAQPDRSGALAPLIDVLGAFRELLARPGNDFAESPWRTREEALRAIDEQLRTLEAGSAEVSEQLALHLAGVSLVHVSLSGGWFPELERLSGRFVEAWSAVR